MTVITNKPMQQWPLWWRISALLNISFFSMMTNAFISAISPLFGLMIADFHCTPNEAAQLSSYAVLALGSAVGRPTLFNLSCQLDF
jgi:hypothetical protein